MLKTLTDKAVLLAFFERDKPLHLYEIGDLDPFFWPSTRWFGWAPKGELRAIALLYSGSAVPTLLLFERTNIEDAAALLRALKPQLPGSFYAHITPRLTTCLANFELTPHGRHLKMVLRSSGLPAASPREGIEVLGPEHEDELASFYERSYPGNWFTPRMLETGKYVGVRDGGELIAVAGVHVYSPEFGVAALGNITTLPEARGRGLGGRVTGHLCRSLLETVNTVGLNVHAENEPAIRCYRRLGFEVVADYEEHEVNPSR